MLNGNRALDFIVQRLSQPGNPGPVAAVTNASLGFRNRPAILSQRSGSNKTPKCRMEQTSVRASI